MEYARQIMRIMEARPEATLGGYQQPRFAQEPDVGQPDVRAAAA